MKKALLLSLGIAFFVGCSTDSDINSEIENIDLTKIINPDTARSAAEFDNTSSGIYRGVFVSSDMAYHGVLTVNLANDSQYNAVLEYGNNQRLGFVRVNSGPASVSNVIEFRGNNAGFILDVSDFNKPVITEGYVDGQGAQLKVLKQTSTKRVNVVLGTFSDDLDPTFIGSWDLIGTSGESSIPVPTDAINLPDGGGYPAIVDVTVNNLDELVVTRNGVSFTDDKMEAFTNGPNCFVILPSLPTDLKFLPFFSGEQTQVLEPTDPTFPTYTWDIDEYAAGEQFSILAGDLATWTIAYSKAAGGKYYTINCVESPLGGTWSWKGRRGHILLTL